MPATPKTHFIKVRVGRQIVMAAPVLLGTMVAYSLHVIEQGHLHVRWQEVCMICTTLFAFTLAITWVETATYDIIKPCKSFYQSASIVKGSVACFEILIIRNFKTLKYFDDHI